MEDEKIARRPWTIGVCAVGLREQQAPSPGKRALLTVTVTADDGYQGRWTTVWEGYTAREAWQSRLARLREAGALILASDRAALRIERPGEVLVFSDMDEAS